MAEIVKNKNAPEGELDFSVGNDTFKVSDEKPYETDDVALINTALAHDWLDVKTETDSKSIARQERDDNKELAKERAKAKKQRAEKDPLEPAADIPETVEEAKEIKASEGDNH